MARMSAEKRIELGNKMISRWEAANCDNDRNVQFVKDMLLRLSRNRSLTPKQRQWYDSTVLSDPPAPKNKELVDSLLSDADLMGMEKTSQVLRDFAYKFSRGWTLSEKQQNFMQQLQTKAADIRKNGRWAPTLEEKSRIEVGVAFCRRYDQYYLAGQPGKAKAHRECFDWLSGELDYLEKWSAQKMMDLCKSDRAKMHDATERWPVGSLAQTKTGQVGLVVDIPSVSKKGKPCLSLLLDGTYIDVVLDDLKKQRRSKKAAA